MKNKIFSLPQAVTFSSICGLFLKTLSAYTRNITIISISIFLLAATTAHAQRGYARIKNGTLVTDHDDLIRGCHSHIMSFAKDKYKNLSWWQALRDKGHLNCVRMMAYNTSSWYGGSGAGVNTQDLGGWLDIAVENASKAGMYIIIDDHGYCCGNKMPLNQDSYQHGKDFWNYVAQRYGKYTHVIFEIKNEPPDNSISSDSWTAHTKSLYKIIRTYAPNTPVITHTPGADNDNELVGGINKCSTGSDPISYSPDGGNALVAWHGYGTGDLNSAKTDLNGPYVWQTKKIAGVICDEFGDDKPDHGYDIAKFLEGRKVSWVWLCVNEMEFGSGTAIKTGYDWVRYPPTWPKDPYAVDFPTGLAMMDTETRINIYPNPAEDFVIIHIDSPITDDMTVELRNCLGQVIRTITNEKSGRIELNTSALASGIYQVSIHLSGKASITKKLVISK